jgi:peptidoglycan-associated lipoprotein
MQQRSALLLILAALLAGCGSVGTDPRLPDAVIVRSGNSTIWTTDESLAAEAAAEAAKARAALAARAPRPRPAPPPEPQSQVAPVVADAAAGNVATALPPRTADTERIVYFDFDRFDIRDEFKFMIERRARVLLGAPQQGLVVEGHADERGGREYNLALGQKRAEAVIRALALLGVQETQLEAVSFGDTRPAVAGGGEEAWAQNRRAELKDR